jgi:large repetitive protein
MRRSFLLACMLVGCGGGGDDPGITNPPPAPVATVTVSSPTGLSVVAGQTAQLFAAVSDAQGNSLSGRTVTWSSSAEAVATVSTSGMVTAVSAGTAQIRATSEGKTGEATVTVIGIPWTLTGSLASGRTLPTATLLTNGKVLVTGGQSLGTSSVVHATSELYDPATGTWSATGSMATGRANHTAVRLPNGKVLIVGGYSIAPSERLRSAELYDPVTGTWSSAGNMAVARNGAGLDLLSNGTVLASGGSATGTDLNATNSSEVFDPNTGTWTTVGNMSVARSGHSSTVLGNGKVLMAAGGAGTFTSPQLHSSAELYDPVARTYTATGAFTTPRGFHRSVLLQNGRVLTIGGSNFTTTAFGNSDLYDPTAGTWTATAPLFTPRISHSATLLANGRVLVAGGSGNASGVLASAEVYDAATGTWTATQPMRTARSNHAAVLLPNGKVLVVGGQGTGASTTAELFDPAIAFASLANPDGAPLVMRTALQRP